jgi:hypothetical protein
MGVDAFAAGALAVICIVFGIAGCGGTAGAPR